MYLMPGLFCDITIPRFFVSRPFSPSMYFFGRTDVLIFHKFSMLVTFENANLKKGVDSKEFPVKINDADNRNDN